MDGIQDLFLRCIRAFPDQREEYLKNKEKYKKQLQEAMIELSQKLRDKRLLKSFLDKSIFNGGEVNFLVIKEGDKFHVFWGKDVVETLSEAYEVDTSKARQKGHFDHQKVVFKVRNLTHGEIEMRNDSEVHYREVKFWLSKKLTLALLKEKMDTPVSAKERLLLYKEAKKKLYKRLSAKKE